MTAVAVSQLSELGKRNRGHVKDSTDGMSTGVRLLNTHLLAAVVGEWCDSNKLRDLAAIPLTQFGQLRHGNSRHDIGKRR